MVFERLAILRLDLLLEFVSFLLSFTVAYFALRGYRVTGERGLLYLHAGFLLTAVGMLLRVVFVGGLLLMGAPALPLGAARSLTALAEVLYSGVRVVAYAVFVLMYARLSFGRAEGMGFQVLPILIYNPYFEIIAILLLGYVTLQATLNWLLGRRVEAFLVFLGFALLLLSHVLFFLTLAGFGFYMAGQVFQLLAFAMIMAMVVRVRRS